MSRGIGKTQRRILDELAAIGPPTRNWLFIEGGWLSVMELAERIGISDRQVRRAVRALEDRGLVIITRQSVFHGVGEYGPLVPRNSAIGYSPDLPTAKVVKAGERWPWGVGYVARRDTELIHAGIPSPALRVWLPENRISYLKQEIDLARKLGGPGSADGRAEYERITATGGARFTASP